MVESEPDHRHPGLRLASPEGREDDLRPVHPEEVRAAPPIGTGGTARVRTAGRIRTRARTAGRTRTRTAGRASAAPAHDRA
ncbi:hypothetical protein ACGFNX_06115 [Streptomyces sp. NPDC048723]|uniref:hypothetical protein n=1 Tax=Streptomyces sp. NPDC048723 TaxID=3365589 RepID=UPI00371B8EE8